MRQFWVFLLLCSIQRVDGIDQPPSIYEFIEQNAHICTSIPVDGRNIVNFLTPAEGAKCSLCPETQQNKVPTSACAVEVSPNEVDVEIGCHPVPELCVLELRTRYEGFFGGTKTTEINTSQNPSPQEEEIFMAKFNPFEQNVVGSLGRSSSQSNASTVAPPNSQPTSAIPRSSVFVGNQETSTPVSSTTQTTISAQTTTIASPLKHDPPFNTPETTTTIPHNTTSNLIEIDADSGIASTTVRANIFSSPNGGAPIHIAGRLHEIATHGRVSIPMLSTSSTRSPLVGTTTQSLNREMVPNEQAKLNPSKSLFEKRVITQPHLDQTTTRPSTNNSWALFRSIPISASTSASLETTTKQLVSNDEETCVDSHLLCCFWAISGECDSNPYWMRIKCSKTCGTCNCTLQEADQCISTGINCTIPTTTVSTTSTSTTQTSTTTTQTSTTTTQASTTSQPTPPPKFSRFTVKTRKLPSWKSRPLENNPAAPPAFRPENEEDGTSIQVEKSVSTTTVGSSYADDDSVKGGTSFVGRPAIQSSTASVGNSLEADTPVTEASTSTSTEITTVTPANCFDYNRLCKFWSDLGECIRNPFWMRPHCQRSCQSCGESLNDVFAPKSKEPNCSNLNVLCPFWAFIGECARNPRWMLKNCAPSCQVC